MPGFTCGGGHTGCTLSRAPASAGATGQALAGAELPISAGLFVSIRHLGLTATIWTCSPSKPALSCCRHQPGSLTRTWGGFRESAHRAWTGSLGQCVQGPGGTEAEGTWAGREVLVPCMCVCVCVRKYVSVNEHVCRSGFISMCLFVHVSVCLSVHVWVGRCVTV